MARNRLADMRSQRKRREARIAEGICIDCPSDAVCGVRCRTCAAKHSERARAYYHRNAAKCRAYQLARYYARKAAA